MVPEVTGAAIALSVALIPSQKDFHRQFFNVDDGASILGSWDLAKVKLHDVRIVGPCDTIQRIKSELRQIVDIYIQL